MYISFVAFGSIGATAGYNPYSMNARFINNYVVIVSFEFWKTISKDHIIVQRLGRMVWIRVTHKIRSDVIREGKPRWPKWITTFAWQSQAGSKNAPVQCSTWWYGSERWWTRTHSLQKLSHPTHSEHFHIICLVLHDRQIPLFAGASICSIIPRISSMIGENSLR